jgi:carboxynorspermidine decarboxylase
MSDVNAVHAELFGALPTPCYVIDEAALRRNGEILASVMKNTGCKILLAQKAFSNFDFYPLLSGYLSGTAASGLYEARLGKEKMPGGEVHVFCAAYREDEFDALLSYADHIVFNSPGQLRRFGPRAKARGKSLGLRINPQCSTQEGREIYDPCAPGSRLGTTRAAWDREMTDELIEMLDGLHFHTLCEQDSDALAVTLQAVGEKFGDVLPKMKWLNMGGGHHITKEGYDLPRLEKCVTYAQEKWGLQVYLEPGEAVALNAGYLASRVLDIVENGGVKTAILDASAACHMPDVIEMPYTPPLHGADAGVAGGGGAGEHVYRLGGPTCLSGDIIGDYGFREPLREGDMLLFCDMAIYTTCKNNTFNGMPLPDIWRKRESGELEKLTAFGYEDFVGRLGGR